MIQSVRRIKSGSAARPPFNGTFQMLNAGLCEVLWNVGRTRIRQVFIRRVQSCALRSEWFDHLMGPDARDSLSGRGDGASVEFPYRDLIVLTAFSVVLGTLVMQGLTLKPLLRALELSDDGPVGRELNTARERALRAGLGSLVQDRSPVAELVRREFTAHLAREPAGANAGDITRSNHSDIYRGALQAARQAVLEMRANDEIGDDAFHLMEEELDWLEMAGAREED